VERAAAVSSDAVWPRVVAGDARERAAVKE
jgi:hypothetical protein